MAAPRNAARLIHSEDEFGVAVEGGRFDQDNTLVDQAAADAVEVGGAPERQLLKQKVAFYAQPLEALAKARSAVY